MIKILSKQKEILFFYASSPVTIDKRKEWGASETNIQYFPNGCFLKISNDNYTVSHGVQPNNNNTAPIGWFKKENSTNTFQKKPIWVDTSKVIKVGETYSLITLDGPLLYTVKKDSLVVYNGDEEPNLDDKWLITIDDLTNNYWFDINTIKQLKD